ncbi:Cytochrome P450 52A13 [Colletotrichum tanaceti]|uniref:Cytochrome P450 52A13 n=1 Tax=Colletotrichum tanaceti TaxID=1306861 RepID=A0A4U6X941_9PEZI|nr:Cytochrome P450 52A13 [Colletotrichum tanaceti]TKW51935.1 Cytochrome P450 52A13 [Colletotrichum tanaceti]
MASSIPSAGLPQSFASNLTGFAGNIAKVISPYIPDAIKSNLNTVVSTNVAQEMSKSRNWAVCSSLLVASIYVFDRGVKSRRDKRLRQFGSPPPLVPFKAPFGIDLAVYSLYRFFRFTFFELVNSWLEAVPGRTVEMRMFGTGLIFTDEPANIKAIMSTEWSSFGRGEVTKRIWGDMLGETQIFVVDGQDWHNSKERIKTHVMKLRPDDLEITEKHAQKLFQRFDVGKPVEVYDVADRYQLDVVSEVFFGESADSLTGHHPFREPMETLHPINTARMLFGKNAYYVKDKYLAPKALKELHDYTSGIVRRAYARDLTKKSPEDYNMLDDLVSQGKSVEDMKDSMMTIMLGGKDPSAILIAWAIFLMGKHPNVMKKMQAEVERVCGDKPPSASDLKDMAYIRHVINETFRLYHPLGMNVRMALKDATLPIGGGASGKEPVAVPKDTTIIYSLGGLQRRKDIYGEDALEFRPERWEGANINRWHFIPYNHGPRHCLGQKFGQQQMEYVLARICQEYDEIRIPPGQPEQQIRIELNLKMAHPCMCEFVKKSKYQ